MFFPESLYQLSARDQQVTWLDPLIRTQTGQLSDVTVPTDGFEVPLGRVLILQALSALAIAGAGQVTTRTTLQVVIPGAQTIQLATQLDNGRSCDWQGSIIVPPSYFVRAVGQFDSGVQPNTVVFSAFGILIPAGNVQRV